ncbi:MAG: DUF4340 domain-containing protein [Clostridia bacterium]|nr:DUF4340 domain-containing protein [Clostridia bacterium]
MINKKNIIILVSAIVVLTAITALVFMWDGTPETEEQSTESQVITIFKGDEASISTINVTIPGENITFNRVDSENWQIQGLENVSIKNFSIGMLASDVATITAKSLVEQNAADLAKYGLENPQYIISASFSDGTVKTFYGGIQTALGDAYYFKDKDSADVYTIYSNKFDSMFADTMSYRDTASLYINKETVVGVKVEKKDYTLNLQLMDEPLTLGGYNLATWEMTQPSYQTIDISRLTTYVMDVLPTVTINSIVSDNNDYANYGLDKPYAVVTVTNTDGSKQTIKLGNSNDNEYYILVDDDTTIYSANKEAFTYVDVDPFLLINKFVSIYNIDDVDNVVVKSGGAEYKLSLEGDGDNRSYKLNGTAVEEEKFKTELYQQVIGLIVDEFCYDAVYSTPAVTIEYTLKDGSYSKAEFVNYDDRNYAVFKDGKSEFIILKKNVTAMLDALKAYAK